MVEEQAVCLDSEAQLIIIIIIIIRRRIIIIIIIILITNISRAPFLTSAHSALQ